jgi:hypothetical protein
MPHNLICVHESRLSISSLVTLFVCACFLFLFIISFVSRVSLVLSCFCSFCVVGRGFRRGVLVTAMPRQKGWGENNKQKVARTSYHGSNPLHNVEGHGTAARLRAIRLRTSMLHSRNSSPTRAQARESGEGAATTGSRL